MCGRNRRRLNWPSNCFVLSFLLQESLAKAFIAGSLSGTCSTLLFQPFDLVKTRLQVSPAGRLKLGWALVRILEVQETATFDLNFEIDEDFRYSSHNIFLFDRGTDGMLYTFYSVARREHIVGLWRGLVPVSFFQSWKFLLALESYGGSYMVFIW